MVTWQQLRLLPFLVKSGMSAPKTASLAWENFWKGVGATGAGGDVLWDPDHEGEQEFCVAKLETYCDRSLPVVDVGCGNGRFTRLLSNRFEKAIGVDLSPSAVARAARETPSESGATFRVADVTRAGWGEALHRELGDSHLFTRGLLHVLSHAEKLTLVSNARALLGSRGTLCLLETAFPGSSLEYLEFLGARDGQLPAPLRRAVVSGIPKPGRFAQPELEQYFPASQFRVVEAGPAPVFAVGMNANHRVETIPGFFAVLRNAAPP